VDATLAAGRRQGARRQGATKGQQKDNKGQDHEIEKKTTSGAHLFIAHVANVCDKGFTRLDDGFSRTPRDEAMTTITATTAAESEAAIANLKIGDVIKVPGNRTRVTVTSIQRLFGCTTVIHTTGKTEDGGKLWADDMTGGFYFEAVYKKINHFRTFEIVAA
jgi:hypothetical protein